MSESEYSFSYFQCQGTQPTTEWFFSMLVLGATFSIFLILYFYRLCFYRYNHPEYPITSLLSRILFVFSIAIKASFCFLIGFGFSKQIEFSVFKYLVSDFPKCIVASSITYILYSWCQVFLYGGATKHTDSLFVIEIVMVIYNSFIYGTFSILFFLRCILSESVLHKWSLSCDIFIVIIDFFLAFVFSMVLFIMKRQSDFSFSCNLGNPEHYLFVLCIFFIAVYLIQTGFDITLCISNSMKLTECSEFKLLLLLCSECFGQLLPLGFISIVDVISLPPPPPELPQNISLFCD